MTRIEWLERVAAAAREAADGHGKLTDIDTLAWWMHCKLAAALKDEPAPEPPSSPVPGERRIPKVGDAIEVRPYNAKVTEWEQAVVTDVAREAFDFRASNGLWLSRRTFAELGDYWRWPSPTGEAGKGAGE